MDYCRLETKQKRMVVRFISSHSNGNNRHDVYFAWTEYPKSGIQDIQVVKGVACVPFAKTITVH
jgi:hypothetical protein